MLHSERTREYLDFPCNQFGQQAPGTDESIHQFCKLTYGTEFQRYKKIKVNGDYLTDIEGLGILDGFLYEMQEFTVYPVVNAQNIK